MPMFVKIHTYKDFLEQTKNLKILYYNGAVLSAGDIFESFFIKFKFQNPDEIPKFIEKIKDLIEIFRQHYGNSEGFNEITLDVYQSKWKNLNGILFKITPTQIGLPLKYYFLIEILDNFLFEFINKHDLKIISYINDRTNLDPIDLKITYDPRNPDPNYLFFLKDNEEPNCILN